MNTTITIGTTPVIYVGGQCVADFCGVRLAADTVENLTALIERASTESAYPGWNRVAMYRYQSSHTPDLFLTVCPCPGLTGKFIVQHVALAMYGDGSTIPEALADLVAECRKDVEKRAAEVRRIFSTIAIVSDELAKAIGEGQ